MLRTLSIGRVQSARVRTRERHVPYFFRAAPGRPDVFHKARSWPLAQLYRLVLTPLAVQFKFPQLVSAIVADVAGIAMATLDCFSFLSTWVYGVTLRNGFPSAWKPSCAASAVV